MALTLLAGKEKSAFAVVFSRLGGAGEFARGGLWIFVPLFYCSF